MIMHGVLSHLIFFGVELNPTGVLQITSQNLCKCRNIVMWRMQGSKNAPPPLLHFLFIFMQSAMSWIRPRLVCLFARVCVRACALDFPTPRPPPKKHKIRWKRGRYTQPLGKGHFAKFSAKKCIKIMKDNLVQVGGGRHTQPIWREGGINLKEKRSVVWGERIDESMNRYDNFVWQKKDHCFLFLDLDFIIHFK